MRRSSEAFQRTIERKRKQDAARRLRDAVPSLLELELDVREVRGNLPGHEVHHKRVVIVDRAPALFEFACSDRGCEEGGHDVTEVVLQELARGTLIFSGVHRCGGHAREGNCDYELRFEAQASYRAATQTTPH